MQEGYLDRGRIYQYESTITQTGLLKESNERLTLPKTYGMIATVI